MSEATIQEGDEVVNPSGGKQSYIKGWPTLIPPYALLAESMVFKKGAKYGVQNWHQILVQVESVEGGAGELDHAIYHYLNFVTGQGDDPLEELSHFVARALMALDQYIREHPGCLDEREYL